MNLTGPWRPAPPAPAADRALRRTVCRLLSLATTAPPAPGQPDHSLRAELGEWGAAVVVLRCTPGEAARHGPRAALVIRLAGSVTTRDGTRLLEGRAILDGRTRAALDVSLTTGRPVRQGGGGR